MGVDEQLKRDGYSDLPFIEEWKATPPTNLLPKKKKTEMLKDFIYEIS